MKGKSNKSIALSTWNGRLAVLSAGIVCFILDESAMQNTFIADAKQVPISTMVAEELCAAWMNWRYYCVHCFKGDLNLHSMVFIQIRITYKNGNHSTHPVNTLRSNIYTCAEYSSKSFQLSNTCRFKQKIKNVI